MLVFCDELKFPADEIDILNKLLIDAIQIWVNHKVLVTTLLILAMEISPFFDSAEKAPSNDVAL